MIASGRQELSAIEDPVDLMMSKLEKDIEAILQ
jgi:hypothetical protein